MSFENKLSVYEKEILKQFRRNVSDILTSEHTDAELMKWLRSRDFDLMKAEEIFREVDSSRKTYGINTIVETYQKAELFEKFERTCLLGFCKEGSLIRYINVAMDFYGFIMATTTYEACEYSAYVLECDKKIMMKENMRTGREVSGMTYVIDMSEFNLKSFLSKYIIQMGLDLLPIIQNHYPEFARRVFIVNVPSMFESLYNIFKSAVRDSLKRRLFVATHEHTAHMLRKYIDEDILPVFLGGNRFDSKGDPYCKELIGVMKIIPEKYYLRNCRHLLSPTDDGVKAEYIPARTSFNIPIIIREAGTRMKIEFRTENGDIYFEILYRPFGRDLENPDIPAKNEFLDPYDKKCNVQRVSLRLRVFSQLWTSTETALAHRPGIHILQFDNSGSWLTSRTLYYRITLLGPEIKK